MNEDNNNTVYTFTEQTPEQPKPPKKKNTWVKILCIVLAAVLFGTVAGVSMLAVTKVTGVLDAYKNAAVEMKDKGEDTLRDIRDGETSGPMGPGGPFGKAPGECDPDCDKNCDPDCNRNCDPGSSRYSDEDYAAIAGAVNDVSNIVESTMPSVVAISCTAQYEAYSWFGVPQTYEATGAGSGIIVGEDDDEYMIVTNNHVVQNTTELSVVFIDGESVEAKIKGRDSDKDIAVISVKKEDLKPETKKAISIAKIGDSDKVKVGQGVIAIGNALGYGQSVTVGYISALDREITAEGKTIKGLIQTDAAINPGNSGGALLNMDGEVIGINAAKYSSTEVEGVGYAIPISSVRSLITNFSNNEVLAEVEEGQQGYIGIQGQNIDDQMAEAYDMPKGVYVYKIVDNVPAADSELREKDIITAVDGQNVYTMEEMREFLDHKKGGETVELTVMRLKDSEYSEMKIKVELANKKDIESE